MEVLLLNLLLPVIMFVGAMLLLWRYNKTKKISTGIKGLVALIVVGYLYTMALPSYLPKGTAPVMAKVPIEDKEVELKDKLRKPDLSKEEREKRVDELLTVRKEAAEILSKDNKEEKQ